MTCPGMPGQSPLHLLVQCNYPVQVSSLILAVSRLEQTRVKSNWDYVQLISCPVPLPITLVPGDFTLYPFHAGQAIVKWFSIQLCSWREVE